MPDKTEDPVVEEQDQPEPTAEDAPNRLGAVDPNEPSSGPIEPTPEQAAAAQRAADMGIVGDPDAPPGYFVDENFRPNPLDVGSLVTTEHHGGSSYDLKAHSVLFANPGADPFEGVDVPPSPEPPPPMGATDYMANPIQVPETEEAVAAHNESMVATQEASAAAHPDEVPAEEDTEEGDPKVAAAKAKADATVEAAEETVAAVDEVDAPKGQKTPAKAQGATKAAPPSPSGTKDTALESDPKK